MSQLILHLFSQKNRNMDDLTVLLLFPLSKRVCTEQKMDPLAFTNAI